MKILRKNSGTFFIVLALFLSVRVWSAQYGLGALSSAACSELFYRPSAHSGALSPAALSRVERGQFDVGFTTSRYQVKLDGEVLLDSPLYRTQEGRRSIGEISDIDQSENFWTLGLAGPVKFFDRSVGLGLSVVAPGNVIRKFRSNTPYEFQALNYGGAQSQLQATLGAGFRLADSVGLGLGAQFGVEAQGAADADLVAENPTGRLYMDVGLSPTFIASAEYEMSPTSLLSFKFSQRQAPKIRQSIRGRAEVAGLATVALPAVFDSVLYFQPRKFEGEFSQKMGGRATLVAGISWNAWSGYEPAYANIELETTRGPQTTQLPELGLHDTWEPRIAGIVEFGAWALSAGYRFRASPMGTRDGVANLLDSDTHILGLGAELSLGMSKLGFFGQLHRAQKISVEKPEGYIGSPGYQFQADAYFLGAHLSTAL